MAFNILDWEIITKEQAESTQYDYGCLIKNFNPETWTAPVEGTSAFITTNQIQLNHAVTYENLGSDINGIHVNYKELEIVNGVESSTMTFTALGFSANDIKTYIGAATVSGNKVSTTLSISDSDFQNIAWVGHKIDGGWVACVMPYALSTGGLNITANKNQKGTSSVTLTGFRSITNKQQSEIECYVKAPAGIAITAQPASKTAEEGTATTFTVSATGATGYQWQLCAVGSASYQDISGETTSTLALASGDVTLAANGNVYRCKLTNTTDTVYSEGAILTVTESE